MNKTAVIGLGAMGYGMAQALLRAGHTVWGVDLNADAVDRFRGEGGASSGLNDVAGDLDAVVVVVLNADQLRNALFGGEAPLLDRLKPGAVVVACPTIPPDVAKRLEARVQSAGAQYLDAPISGGAAKAAEGRLTIMASGSAEAFARAEPALSAMAETVFRLGDEAGPASAMKAVNQLLAGVHIAAMGEAMAFGLSQGVSTAQTLEVISKCAGQSFMFENRGAHVVDGDYTPRSAVDIWLKDLGIVLDIAKDAKVSAPLASAALQQFVAASGSGLGREDDAAVVKIYARNAGLALPGDDGPPGDD